MPSDQHPGPSPREPLCALRAGRGMGRGGTHHDASEKTDTFPTVRVGHHVPIADGQERDGDEPHGAQKVTGHILLVMVPAKGRQDSVWESHPVPQSRGMEDSLQGRGGISAEEDTAD